MTLLRLSVQWLYWRIRVARQERAPRPLGPLTRAWVGFWCHPVATLRLNEALDALKSCAGVFWPKPLVEAADFVLLPVVSREAYVRRDEYEMLHRQAVARDAALRQTVASVVQQYGALLEVDPDAAEAFRANVLRRKEALMSSGPLSEPLPAACHD